MFDKDDQEISQRIDAALAAVLSGKATIEQVLARDPDHAAVLRPELEAALWLISQKEQVAPRSGFVASSRKRVLGKIKQEARDRGAKRAFFGFMWPRNTAFQWVAALVVIVILLSGVTGGLVTVSAKALPGESLYPVKRASEEAALALTLNSFRRVELSEQYTQRRLDEVSTLVEQGKTDNLAATLESFVDQTNQTVTLLDNANDNQPHQKKMLALEINKNLAQHAAELQNLNGTAGITPEISQELGIAESTALNGSAAAAAVAQKILDPTETPTPTLEPTLTASPTPDITDTPSGKDPTKKTPPGQDKNPSVQPGNIPDPKPTHTPKPTNDNRQPKTGVSTSSDNSSSPGQQKTTVPK